MRSETLYPNRTRMDLRLEHPVKCIVPGCITVLSRYNLDRENICWLHDRPLERRRWEEALRILENR